MTIDAQSFVGHIEKLIPSVATSQTAAVGRAARLISASLLDGGVIQAFGSGHSESISMEIAGRAGGLVPTNKIALRDLVLYGGEPASLLGSPELERDPAIAQKLYDLIPVQPQDAFVITSNSGVNGTIVEFATIVKEKGHALIAITSLKHTHEMTSRHPSGRKLIDLADVVLDNGAPYGDSMMDLPGGGTFGAVSTITSALLAQMTVAEVVKDLLAAGQVPPVYLSANMAGGDEHNRELEARYAGRIRRGA
ncbi:sugar isomerase domain-containing protein [Streptomyces sp. NPDC005773]|uniref:sugar isomerase domain-containing protein n=1 Tax=Streptomyces sp. NPDC005773 TaxID=3364727 RepID=UPI00369567C6|nr:SIS domain-containing protein [Streptomyces sp. NBC_00995]